MDSNKPVRIEPLQKGGDARSIEVGLSANVKMEVHASGADPVEILQLEKRDTPAGSEHDALERPACPA